MFDISWSELLILGIVTLIFVGPKELPVLMRTLGRYAGVVRRHANEFRAQFEAAMREAELDSMRKEVEHMQTSINSEIMTAKKALSDTAASTRLDEPPPPSSSPTSGSAAANLPEPAAETKALATPPMPAPPRMEP